MSRVIRCKYDVLGMEPSAQAAPAALLERARELGVDWMRIDRIRNPRHFRPATYGIHGNSDPFRQCQQDLWSPRAWVLHGSSSGWSITCETAANDLEPLQAAMALAASCARGCKNAVVIDRTTSIGYSSSQFAQEQRSFNEQSTLDVRDHVLIYEHTTMQTVKVRTYGMEKFGQENFMVENFPANSLDDLRWFFNMHLCPYTLEVPIKAGHTFRYRMGTGGILQFSRGNEDCLLMTDHAAPGTIPTLRKFLSIIPPFYSGWKTSHTAGAETYISDDETAEVLAVVRMYQSRKTSDQFPIPQIRS